ncbi:MAG: hypothetical protein K8J31_11970 [Anaerolineae bacterium]|nr:hypothetical protein [Anaerolineae bacterium]
MTAISFNDLLPVGDLRLLFWLRSRQFRDSAIYWLRLMGYEPQEKAILQNIYIIYLLGIAAVWLFAMWAWCFDTATNIGAALEPTSLADVLTLLPYGVLGVQIFTIVMTLRSTPLKLSFADMAYVAGSPIARSVPVLLGFIRQVITRSLLFGAIWALATVALLGPVQPVKDMIPSLEVAGVVALVVIFTWAIAWLLGILRLVYPQVSRWRGLWLLPLLLIAVAYWLPDLVLWPGRAIILVMYGLEPVWLIPFLILVALVLVVAFLWFSKRINMIQAVDESVVYARLAALGLLAWRMPDLQFRIRLQESQAGRKPRLKLPRAYGQNALVMRAAVSYIRHPSMLLVNLLWGAVMTYIVVLILVNNLPVQLWIGWLLVAGIAPPIGLLHAYRMDLQETFLRQFLPLNGFQMLVADIILPLIFVIAGSLGVWFLQGFDFETLTMGILFIPLLAFLLALCGAFALTRDRVLQSRVLVTALVFGLTGALIIWTQAPLAGLVVVILAIMGLGGMLVQEA